MTTLIATQQLTIQARPEGWIARVPVQQFDPTLGTLHDLRITFSGSLFGDIALENLGSAAGSFSVALPGSFSLTGDGLNLGAFAFDPRPAVVVTLAAFDRTIDFTGPSGTLATGVFGFGVLYSDLNDAARLSTFTGGGTVDLMLNGDGASVVNADAPFQDRLNVNTGGVITIEYQYTPPSAGNGGSGAGSVTQIAIGPFPTLATVVPVYIGTGQTTAAQTVTLPNRTGGWSSIAAIDKFDPSVGFLRQVLIDISNDLAGTASVENLDTRSWRIGFAQSAAVSVDSPGTSPLAPATTFDTAANLLNLGQYDGVADFAGTSGTVVTRGSTALGRQANAGGGALADAADLAAFTGIGTIDLRVSGTSKSEIMGPPNLTSEIIQGTGATISVKYIYDTTPPNPAEYGLRVAQANAAGGLPAIDGAGPTDPPPSFTTSLISVIAVPACFAAGTRIATRKGLVAVERLRIGDIVMNISGERRPIHWIGHRRIDCRRHPEPDRVMPVRIAAHAFGQGRPGRPVLLSPDHAVFVEDVLIPIKFLINGHTVKQFRAAAVTYFHLELASHDVILAEGLPAETYLETGGRGAFENADGPVSLHATFGLENEAQVAEVWKRGAYAPLRGQDGQLGRARLKLLLQAQWLTNATAERRARSATRSA